MAGVGKPSGDGVGDGVCGDSFGGYVGYPADDGVVNFSGDGVGDGVGGYVDYDVGPPVRELLTTLIEGGGIGKSDGDGVADSVGRYGGYGVGDGVARSIALRCTYVMARRWGGVC